MINVYDVHGSEKLYVKGIRQKMRYFSIKELVSPEILEVIGEEAAWRLIDPVIQTNLDALREDLGMAIVINGLWKGEEFTQSGVRACNCKIGASKSHHKLLYGAANQAFDLKCKDMPKLFEIVKKKYSQYNIVRIEDPEKTRTWLHAEFSNKYSVKSLVTFNPK